MAIIKTLIFIPAALSGLWFAQPTMDPSPLRAERKAKAGTVSEATQSAQELELGPGHDVMARRMRLHNVLSQLDVVAGICMQMAPERSARLEPVLVDLAEQALRLSDDATIRRASTENELDKLEATIARLVKAISRVVEPEFSL